MKTALAFCIMLCIVFAPFLDAQTKAKKRPEKKEAEPAYTVHQKQGQTPKGVNPSRALFDCALVFAEEPDVKTAYKIIVKEIRKITVRSGPCDISMVVFIGKESRQNTWVRMKDEEGDYVFAGWTHATKKIMRGTKVIE
jgi:hypothetical protein